ncbi:unnamed protein product [Caenorhabditis bovis]|uniref:G-protein coupled receptors family 1 profile domain-containing protein n=1 Tax=Caenorhabditis bovis TaxID=2654633 RepID=A0A8S1ELU4_9PELO|nr:unnamed protein product [Caenorhabditis bovis]
MENEDRVIAAVEAEVIADRTERCSNLPITADQVKLTALKGIMQNEESEFNNESAVCDYTPNMRAGFISAGSLVSAIGCISNLLLLYVFITKTRRTYPFQTLLAFLDFMLCALYIYCFGFLAMAVELRIAFLYNLVMDTNVTTLVMSRIVQLAIPYTLIANSADKLTMITGRSSDSGTCFHRRLLVIGLLILLATFLRINGFLTLEIMHEKSCDIFHSKWITHRQLDEAEAEMWRVFENVLTFFHTFVSFVVLCALNIIVVLKLRVEHRRARRQSTSPAQLFSTSASRLQAAQEIREQQHRLRCAVKTTVVIITAYLACNSVNFLLYLMETFRPTWVYEEDGSFRSQYVFISDLNSNLFVLSSTIRLFIYYKYNSDIRQHIKSLTFVGYFISDQKRKPDVLLKVDV